MIWAGLGWDAILPASRYPAGDALRAIGEPRLFQVDEHGRSIGKIGGAVDDRKESAAHRNGEVRSLILRVRGVCADEGSDRRGEQRHRSDLASHGSSPR